jgi:hypothetical protein
MYWLEGLATSDAAVAGDTAEISVPPIRGASHQNSI